MRQTSWLLADRWPEWGRAAARREDSVYLSTPTHTHPLFPLTLTGATATVSTLATVVGQPKTPADRGRGEEGRGGERRGEEGRGGEGRGGRGEEGRGGEGGEERGGRGEEGREGGTAQVHGSSTVLTYTTHPRLLGREASCVACQPSPPDSQ